MLVFLGIFALVLITLFLSFLFFSPDNVESGSRTVLWAAFTILILIFGVIVISLFLNRDRH